MHTLETAGSPHLLHIAALGRLDIQYEGKSLVTSLPLKGQALLVYLALASRPYPRSALAGLLWPDMSEENARTNLRLTLSRMRRQLPPILTATRQTITFDHERPHTLDALDLQALAMKPGAMDPQRLIPLLQSIRGEFLDGFDMPDAPQFEQWVLARRQHYHQLVIDAYTHLLLNCRRRYDFATGIRLARTLVALEPWYEEGHRQLMWLLAYDGQRSAALAQFDACRILLQEELGVSPGAETVTLYQRIKEDALPPLPQTTPAMSPSPSPIVSNSQRSGPAQSDTSTSSPPPQRTPFIGRHLELTRLRDLILDPDYRLVTIIGEGGVGKTRLALAVAQHLHRHAVTVFPDGIHYVSLAPSTTPRQPHDESDAPASQLISALGIALRLNFATAAEPHSQILHYLRHKRCVVLIDNFESLHAPTETGASSTTRSFLLDLLDHAPGLTFLITSRLPLDLQAEYRFRLQGLPVPPDGYSNESATYDSLLLFQERAERAAGRPLDVEKEYPHIVQICRAVNGLPLGIELAASWMRWHPPREIAGTLSALQETHHGNIDSDLVAAGMDDLPPRHRSLRGVFEHSWRLLVTPARHTLAHLSVFHGPFSSAAALAVTGNAQAELASLIDNSLLQRSLEGYYEMHSLVRHFAAAQCLALNIDFKSLQLQHTTYYMQFTAECVPALYGPEAAATLRRLQAEWANVQHAWQEAMYAPHLHLLASALPAMSEYWHITGLFREAQRALQETLSRVQTPHSRPDTLLLARLHTEQAAILYELGRYQEAEQEARRALDLADVHNLPGIHPVALLALARAYWGQGRFDEMTQQVEQGIVAARSVADEATEAVLLRNLAAVAWRGGDLARARMLCQQARRLNAQIGHARNESKDLLMLGIIADNEHNYDEAHAIFQEVLRLAQNSGDRRVSVAAYAEIGVTATHQGRLDRALYYLQRNLDLVQETGSLWQEGVTLSNLGDLKMKLGDLSGAEDAYHAALDRAERAAAPALESNLLAFWSLLENFRENYPAGVERARRALTLARQMNVPREIAFASQFLAHNLLALGHLDEAQHCYEEAHRTWKILDHPARVLEALAGLASVAHAHTHHRARSNNNNDERAVTYAVNLLEQLGTNHLVGADDGARVYLTCHDILRDVDSNRAIEVVNIGAQRLHEKAARIADANLRHSFLENVPTNARLRRLAITSMA